MTMTFVPAPGAAPVARMVAAQGRLELGLMLRNGEQLLLTIVIPVVLLVALSAADVVSLGSDGARRVDVVTPGILALAVMSTAFAAQAIATGFDRRSGALKLLGATPLPRWGLVAAKTVAVVVIEALQVAVLVPVALVLGWQPRGSWLAALVVMLAGTLAFSALGLALAGLLRAEATLAVANGIYLLLLLGGGVVIPLAVLPDAIAAVARWLPSAALGGGLRDVLLLGAPLPWAAVGLLLAWAALGVVVAARTFRWE